jgi:hypothetical protein
MFNTAQGRIIIDTLKEKLHAPEIELSLEFREDFLAGVSE